MTLPEARAPRRASWRTRLTWRLALAFFLPAFAVTALSAGVSLVEIRGALRESAYERLRAASAIRASQFDRWVDEQVKDLAFLATMPTLQASVAAIALHDDSATRATIGEVLQRAITTQNDFSRIVVLSGVGGRVIAASDSSLIGDYRVTEQHFLQGRTGVFVQNVYPSPASARPTLTIAMPIRDASGRTIAVLAGDANLARVDDLIADRSGLGTTGEAYLVDRYHEFVRGNAYDRSRFPRGIHTATIDRAVRGESGAGVYQNYAGQEVVGVYRWMPNRQLALFAEMSTEEAFAPARRLAWEVVLAGVLAVLTLALGLTFVARHIARPIVQIADAATAVARGDLSATAPVRTDDEIGQLAAAFNAMTVRLRTAYGELETQLRSTRDAAHATESSRLLLRAVIDHLPALVAVKGLDGNFLVTNTAFGDYHGMPTEQLVGLPSDAFLSDEKAIAIAGHDAEILRTRATLNFEEVFSATGGDRTYLSARFPLIDAAGEIFAIGVVATDITERKQLQAQVLHQQKLEAVGRLAGGVAHDMNNLLTAVRCNAELVLESMAADDPDRLPLEEIDRSVRNGAALTRQLLTFSRAHVVRPSALDVNRILGGMTPMLRRYVGTGITMKFELAEDLWLVRADEGQMEQVLLNLLSNAHDAMPVGGVATVATTNVVVGPGGLSVPNLAAGEYVRLAVRDTGTGIDPAMVPLLFEPFFTTKDASRGTGLGLSTTYAIVQQSHGAITVETIVARGTTFSIYLPREVEVASPPASTPPALAPAPSEETLLVVDDEPSVRTALRRMLAREGYRILEAASGRDALVLFESHADDIALVLTDVFMAGMSGHELAVTLQERSPALPVVFMSGYTADEVVRRGLMRDETKFLQKPFDRKQLVALVADLLHRSAVSG